MDLPQSAISRSWRKASHRAAPRPQDLVRNDIPPLTRCTLEALIVIFVQNKVRTRWEHEGNTGTP